MKKLVNKTTGCEITSLGINVDGSANCQIKGNIVNLSADLEAVKLLDGKQLVFEGEKYKYGQNVSIGNFQTLMNIFEVENTDVGKKAMDVFFDFGVALIYASNALKLTLTDWDLTTV